MLKVRRVVVRRCRHRVLPKPVASDPNGNGHALSSSRRAEGDGVSPSLTARVVWEVDVEIGPPADTDFSFATVRTMEDDTSGSGKGWGLV